MEPLDRPLMATLSYAGSTGHVLIDVEVSGLSEHDGSDYIAGYVGDSPYLRYFDVSKIENVRRANRFYQSTEDFIDEVHKAPAGSDVAKLTLEMEQRLSSRILERGPLKRRKGGTSSTMIMRLSNVASLLLLASYFVHGSTQSLVVAAVTLGAGLIVGALRWDRDDIISTNRRIPN